MTDRELVFLIGEREGVDEDCLSFRGGRLSTGDRPAMASVFWSSSSDDACSRSKYAHQAGLASRR